ncbi:MAG: toxin-antitoxin system TumE family protein [Burkholderiales bacterium]
MSKAELLLSYKARQGKLLIEMVLWQLPMATADRPHGIKYRLYLGREGKTLVRYDNEAARAITGTSGRKKSNSLTRSRRWSS